MGGSDENGSLTWNRKSPMTQVVSFDAASLGTWRSTGGKWKQRAQDGWRNASPRTQTFVQVGVLLFVVALAYNYSLSTLIQNAGLETPLAYVSLVPAIALALAAIRARPVHPEPAIHDRQVDYIVGLPLVGAALAANLLLPSRLSAMFWVWRIDLLTLPVFVAGAVAIIFGVRVLWRQKLAVSYLFLGWPYPYSSILLRVLDAFTTATLWGVTELLRVVPVATAAVSPAGTLFVITHHGQTFPLSVVSACSGVNSVVGFLLIGSAFGAVVRGPIVRKILWLTGGMILLWAINLGRILFIFWAGKTWGEHIAIDVFHPFIGLVTFSLGVIAMIAVMRPLGLHIGMNWDTPQSTAKPTIGAKRVQAVPKVYAAIVIVTVAAIVLAISNVGLKTYNLVADASGSPRLTSFILSPAAPPGWTTSRIATYDWAKPLFGDTSTWNRYAFYHVNGGTLSTSQGVIGDVIVTPDLGTFSAYGVEACYQFHGYSLQDVAQVSVGGGITGQAMSYASQVYGSWSIVYWIIPVKSDGTTVYERVVLYVRNTGQVTVVRNAARVSGIRNVAGTLNGSSNIGAELIANRSFLVAFARELIQTEASGRASTPSVVETSHTVTSPVTHSDAPSQEVNPAVTLSNG
jgi:exosortase/archaeosortase family protein